MCFNLVLGLSAIYSLRQIFLKERNMWSWPLSWLLHMNTLTAIYSPHMSVHSSEGGAHMVHFCPGNPYLLQSTQPRNFSAFEFEPHCLFQDVANSRVRYHSTAHQLMDCTYIRRRGYQDARWHKTDRNVRNGQVVPTIRPGWTTYGALLLRYLLLPPLEAELSISKVLLLFTRQQAALLNLKRNYQASVIIKCKFYCLFNLRCCNCWLIILVFIKVFWETALKKTDNWNSKHS